MNDASHRIGADASPSPAAGQPGNAGLALPAASPAADVLAGDHVAAGGACANCGTPLVGAYCHACGQSAHVHRSVPHLVEEVLHGVFHFEGRLWRTLPKLLLRPGELTRRYVHGERARFVSPLAAFLFSVFLMFLVSGVLPSGSDHTIIVAPPHQAPRTLESTRAEVDAAVATNEARLRAIAEQLDRARAKGEPTAELEREQRGIERDQALTRASAASLAAGSLGAGLKELARNLDTGHPAFDHALGERLANPELLFYKLKSSAYKLSWLLVPISLPFMWLLFRRRREVHLYDHAIFVLYALSFVSILAIIAEVLVRVPVLGVAVMPLVTLAVPAHLFVHLKGAYQLGTGGALWRTAVMLLFGLVWFLVFVGLLLAVDLWH